MPKFYVILTRKIINITRILMIFARKINKIPEFYTILPEKKPKFYIIIARKYFPRILGGTRLLPRLLRL